MFSKLQDVVCIFDFSQNVALAAALNSDIDYRVPFVGEAYKVSNIIGFSNCVCDGSNGSISLLGFNQDLFFCSCCFRPLIKAEDFITIDAPAPKEKVDA